MVYPVSKGEHTLWVLQFLDTSDTLGKQKIKLSFCNYSGKR